MALGRGKKTEGFGETPNVQALFERLSKSDDEVVLALLFVGLVTEARGFAIERAIRGEPRIPGEPGGPPSPPGG